MVIAAIGGFVLGCVVTLFVLALLVAIEGNKS